MTVVLHVRANPIRFRVKNPTAGNLRKRVPSSSHSRSNRRRVREEDVLQLPPANQRWSHGVNSQDKLTDILEQGNRFTAIESDIILGLCTSCDDTSEILPVMAHPPATKSDLSLAKFLDQVSASTDKNNNNGTRQLTQITKLDFKDIDAVEPSLQEVVTKKILTPAKSDDIFFVNADIVPGPGYGDGDVELTPEDFIPLVLSGITKQIETTGTTNIAWSLGFRTRYETIDCFRKKDFERMNEIMNQYNLLDPPPNQGVGVVVAVNARQLAKRLDVVSSNFVKGGIWADTTVNQLQLLAWTGRSEPPIPRATVEKIKAHFREQQLLDRIGFDVSVVDNYIYGLTLELGICVYGVVNTIINFF